MSRMKIRTKNGFDFYEVASVVQKAIRRGDTLYAGYFALELFASGYSNYLWKRLFTISAEDCFSAITHEIDSLYNGFLLVNQGVKKGEGEKGRIFISKAVILLCQCAKSREADHLQCLAYDKKVLIDDSIVKEYLNRLSEAEINSVPEYTYDVHTLRGKIAGKTKDDFFREEQKSLNNRQESLFDSLFEEGK